METTSSVGSSVNRNDSGGTQQGAVQNRSRRNLSGGDAPYRLLRYQDNRLGLQGAGQVSRSQVLRSDDRVRGISTAATTMGRVATMEL